MTSRAPRRTDPLAAALAFAIREAVRLEAERSSRPWLWRPTERMWSP